MDTPEGDNSKICNEITKIGEFIDVVDKHKVTILNMAGIGQELVEAHEYQDCIEEVQKWLEDILCGIMEGIDVLLDKLPSRVFITIARPSYLGSWQPDYDTELQLVGACPKPGLLLKF
ncbi:hypothetical protein IW261DRAFT_1574689 [Armillaria novae-zelandiae]|uniref:Uncharacterized protein n=1 Tax=Armillaria novae-zelandiae TaxID=153914 RepID=A0AA39NHP9_9AGAR|nr:hypothetical protein IW261DRAFT_1574689 [Armillaria novae-zelandiae]